VICKESELKHPQQAYPKIALTLSTHVDNDGNSNLVGVLQSKSVLFASVHHMVIDGCEELLYEAMDKLVLYHADPSITNTAGGVYAVNEDVPFPVKDCYRAKYTKVIEDLD
jgi:hypothetical protein